MNFWQQPTLVCVSGDSDPIITGARKRICAACDKPVWVSPAMLGAVDAGEYRPRCLPCARVLSPDGVLMVDPRSAADLELHGAMGIANRIAGMTLREADHRYRPFRHMR